MTLPAELFAESISLKQIVFAAITLGFWLISIPVALRYSWMDRVCVAGILFMAINPIDVTFFSYTNYRGDIRGIEFGVTDWLTITLAITMLNAPRWKKRQLHYANPVGTLMLLYLLYAMFTIFTAIVPQFAVFGVTKLLRAYLMFWVASNFVRSEEDLRFIVWCCVGLTFYSFFQVLLDKYVYGVFPPRGSFPHQNSLSTFQNMLNFIVFASFMQDGKRLFDRRSLIYLAATGAGTLTTAATLSRGGMVTMLIGYLLIIVLTLYLKQPSQKIKRKLKALGLIALASLPVMLFVLPAIITRFLTAPEESGDSRFNANLSSAEMGNDHFFGVGLNNYSYAINFLKYGDRLGELDRGIAHHIFWLHYAEMGIIGVTLFTLMTGGFILYALRFILKRKDSLERIIAIGILAAFVVSWMIGTLEWAWRQIQITVAYFWFAGILVSLARSETTGLRERRCKQIVYRFFIKYWMTARKPESSSSARPSSNLQIAKQSQYHRRYAKRSR